MVNLNLVLSLIENCVFYLIVNLAAANLMKSSATNQTIYSTDQALFNQINSTDQVLLNQVNLTKHSNTIVRDNQITNSILINKLPSFNSSLVNLVLFKLYNAYKLSYNLHNQSDKFVSLCKLSNQTLNECERYDCNFHTCVCSSKFKFKISLNLDLPFKSLCLNQSNFNEDCYLEEQCEGKNQTCSNVGQKPSLQDVSKLQERILNFNLLFHLNYAQTLQQQLVFMNQVLTNLYDVNQNLLTKSKCKCRVGFFYNYFLSYSSNKHVNLQFNSFLIQNNLNNSTHLFIKSNKLFDGICLKIRKLDESCQLDSECQMNDPSSVCRKARCRCKNGYRIDSFRKRINLNKSKKTCETIYLNLNFDSENTNLTTNLLESSLESSLNLTNSEQKLRFMSKFLAKSNCSSADDFSMCEGRTKCLKKGKRLHIQENLANLVWTLLCMLSIMLILCMLLVKNRQDENANNYFPRISTTNLNQSTFLSNVFNRSMPFNSNLTELDSMNTHNLLARTPPPEFREVIDEPPSYEEAVLMLQKSETN